MLAVYACCICAYLPRILPRDFGTGSCFLIVFLWLRFFFFVCMWACIADTNRGIFIWYISLPVLDTIFPPHRRLCFYSSQSASSQLKLVHIASFLCLKDVPHVPTSQSTVRAPVFCDGFHFFLARQIHMLGNSCCRDL